MLGGKFSFTFDLSVTPMIVTFFRSTFFLVNVIDSTFSHVSLPNLYHIFISLIAQMSWKLGKIRTETRSWRPIIDHYFFNMRIIWKSGPDSLTITIEQNVQFHLGIYHEKCQHDKIQNGRPVATSDRQLFSLTRFTQLFFMYRSKMYTIYPFH